MAAQLIQFLRDNKDPLTVLLSTCALLISTLALLRPSIKDWLDRRKAIFQALQGDRKAIAVVTLRVINEEWDWKLRHCRNFRKQLLQSLAIASGLESSDRGKAYVFAALQHIGKLDDHFRKDAIKELKEVMKIFEDYDKTGADPHFKIKRIKPLGLILEALQPKTPAQPCAPPNGGPATRLGNSDVTEGPPSVS